MLLNTHKMRQLRKEEELRRSKLSADEIDDLEELTDSDIAAKWYHNTNIEASGRLLERLKRYHSDMDQ